MASHNVGKIYGFQRYGFSVYISTIHVFQRDSKFFTGPIFRISSYIDRGVNHAAMLKTANVWGKNLRVIGSIALKIVWVRKLISRQKLLYFSLSVHMTVYGKGIIKIAQHTGVVCPVPNKEVVLI